MDPLTGVVVSTLTLEYATANATALLAMTADSSWDDWTVSNLLADRPGKWSLSLVALLADAPVGWAICSRTDHSVHLHHLVVAAASRGHRIGALLLREIERRAVADDAPAVTLKVHPDNDGAVRFYRREGYEQRGTSASGYLEYARATGTETA